MIINISIDFILFSIYYYIKVYIGGCFMTSTKSRLVALLLCIFLGYLGIHRFYVGKVGTGIIWILTLGCFGIGTLVDLIMIIVGSFKDKSGATLTNWNTDSPQVSKSV
jgi:TM2 domain-containing membrane protein YozV